MKNKSLIEKKKKTDNQRIKGSSHLKVAMIKNVETNPVYAELIGEGHEDFYNYLDWLGLVRKHDLLILAASHHYYFEIEDLKNIKTVVTLKKLNNIESPKEFLKEIYNILPHKCHFIGSFTDNRKQNIFTPVKRSTDESDAPRSDSEQVTGRWNSFLNVLYGIIDAKANRYMSERIVKLLLEETGLKILDITEFNGLTYFCTQKVNPSVE